MFNLTNYTLELVNSVSGEITILEPPKFKLQYGCRTIDVHDESVNPFGTKIVQKLYYPVGWILPDLDCPVIVQTELTHLFKNHEFVYMVCKRDCVIDRFAGRIKVRSLIRI